KRRTCPETLSSKIEADSEYKNLFNFSTPVLLRGEHFNNQTWKSLQEYKPPYGWRNLSYSDIRSTLESLNDPANGQLFDRKGKDACISCAVVGNGGILNGSKQGKEIDSHNFVFRVNGAIIKGFEEDVGRKTSFYGFTTNTMKNSLIGYEVWGFTKVPQSEEIQYIFIPSGIRDYVMLRSAIQGIKVPSGHDKGDDTRPWLYFGHNTPSRKFKLLHPSFVRYVKDSFLELLLIGSRFGNGTLRSSATTLKLGSLKCSREVAAYGFITDNYKKFSDHYYEDKKQPLVFYANHDMLLELKLWKSLDTRGIINLYQR
uniref:alpha-N-acetylgalactosaminide alpha-2,6-sialyltransferase n=1 Tax=Latimeria chalumnae TaxID=7897 RepID=H3B489_LATCH